MGALQAFAHSDTRMSGFYADNMGRINKAAVAEFLDIDTTLEVVRLACVVGNPGRDKLPESVMEGEKSALRESL